MRGDKFGVRQGLKHVYQVAPRPRVKEGGRLVKEHHRGLHREHRRERRHALFAAGDLERRLAAQMFDMQQGEALVHAPRHLLLGEPHIARAEGDIVVDRGHKELVVGVLEEDADL